MANKLPTIDIKGREYVLVKDRVLAFNEIYKNGSIQTELISPIDSKTIIIKAIVTPDVTNPERRFIDYSQAVIGQGMVNQTAALENASTSAVGRCLAYMGIGVIESIASADEVKKALESNPSAPQEPSWMDEKQVNERPGAYATDKQIKFIYALLPQKGQTKEDLYKKYNVDSISNLPLMDAKHIIDNLMRLPDVQEKIPERDIKDI